MTDQCVLRLLSRHFDLRFAMAFRREEAPPAEEATNIVLAAFGPLFRAYAAMPFDISITGPLLRATLDQLMPHMQRRLVEIGSYYSPWARRRDRRVLVADTNPPIRDAVLRGEIARIHMDRIEAAFGRAQEEGGRVNITTGRHVPDAGPFFTLDDFPRMRERMVRPNAIRRMAHQQTLDVERDLLFGDFNLRPSAADATARETLIHLLNDVQRAEFERTEAFTVAAQDGKMYRVVKQKSFNVRSLDGIWEYCAVPANHECPVYDYMIASKLWLEADFERFMRIANHFHRPTRRIVHRGEGDHHRIVIRDRPNWLDARI